AAKLGFTTSAVSSYRRRKFGFKAHGCVRLFTDQQLIDLHAEGLNDREIGEKLGASKAVVGHHRRRLGLRTTKWIRNIEQKYRV
ncbi:unnamed protein product, partial [marine sediment metagenome]